MTAQITPLSFENHSIRMFDIADQPWFNANDVCEALGFGNPWQAIDSHVDEDDLQKLEVIDNLGRIQRANHINESGLYALILGSTKDTAKRFKRWVTSEVLPALRKTGHYEAPRQDPRPFQAEAMHAAREAGSLRDENMRLKDDLIEAQRQVIQFLTRNEPAPRAAPRPLTEHEKSVIRALHREGYGPLEISKRIQRSRSAVRAVLRYEGEAA